MKKLQAYLNELEFIDTIVGLLAIILILGAALIVQFFQHEPPCPLCLLQRAGFINIGLALLMNLRYGNRVIHWAMVIFSGLTGISVSIRQILLHITDPLGFGKPFFGLHLYTWCFIGFSIAIVGATLMLIVYPEVSSD